MVKRQDHGSHRRAPDERKRRQDLEGDPRPKRLRSSERSRHVRQVQREPLERGFGTTLGVALRRVLLSSLQGAAITHIAIEGALHEFTSLPGVVEDVTDIMLNLKEVPLLQVDATRRTTCASTRPARFNAGDIAVDGVTSASTRTPSRPAPKAAGRMELRSARPRLRRRRAALRAPIGTIAIDALFSPIRKVNFIVTNARVGQQTDYDKLTLEAWTNGSVTPQDAVAYAAKILKEQLNLFINFEESRARRGAARDEAAEKLNENLWLVPSTSWSSRCARPTACRTPTSSTSASSCRRPSPRC